VQALEDAVVAVMIEKASAVENVEIMLWVKGVDMVQFGPAEGKWEAHVIKGNGAKLRAHGGGPMSTAASHRLASQGGVV
jgi:2-keto-3-deoxy-L-rhamnonate aldolase RhmA